MSPGVTSARGEAPLFAAEPVSVVAPTSGTTTFRVAARGELALGSGLRPAAAPAGPPPGGTLTWGPIVVLHVQTFVDSSSTHPPR